MIRPRSGRFRAWLCALVVTLLPSLARADAEAQARQYLKAGLALRDAHDVAGAAALFAKARDLVPTKAAPYRHLGLAEAELGRCREALADFEAFFRYAPAAHRDQPEVMVARDQCQKQLAAEPPPATVTPPPVSPRDVATAPPQPPPPAPPPTLTAPQPAAVAPAPVAAPLTEAPRPLVKRPAFWVALVGGAAVIAAVALGLAFGLSSSEAPTPSLGAITFGGH